MAISRQIAEALEAAHDRFKLKTRRETRESAIYELVLARSDQRFGEKLRETSADCVAQRSRGTASGESLDAARVRGGDPIPCGMVMSGGNRIAAGGETMTRFATMLVPLVQRIVVDNTGLTGLYDFDLQFLPDQGYVRGLPVRDCPEFRVRGGYRKGSSSFSYQSVMRVGAVGNRVLCGFLRSGGRVLCVHGSGGVHARVHFTPVIVESDLRRESRIDSSPRASGARSAPIWR